MKTDKKLLKAIETLEGLEYELSIVSNNNKASEKSWQRLVKATKTVLEVVKEYHSKVSHK